jgi:integrase
MATTKTWTDTYVRAIAKPESRAELSVPGYAGLLLVVQPSGTKAWAWRGKLAGKSVKKTLGNYPLYALADAQEWARDISKARALGVDPFVALADAEEEKRVADAAKAKAAERTCDWCFTIYMEAEGKLRKSHKEKQRIWDRDIKPAIGDTPISDLTADELVDLIDERSDKPASAIQMYALLKRWLSWCEKEGRRRTGLENNPGHKVHKPGDLAPRDRDLNEYEVTTLFRALGNNTFAKVIKLLLYTACRRSEVIEARWSEIDLEKRVWEIPTARSKNGKAFLVALSDPAIAILKSIEVIKDCEFVFPARRNPKRAISGITKMTNIVRADVAALAVKDGREIGHWRLHDLRRTGSTMMNGMLDADEKSLIPPHVVEETLNHAKGKVAGIYNKHQYLAEKRRALTLWAEALNKLSIAAVKANEAAKAAAEAEPLADAA